MKLNYLVSIIMLLAALLFSAIFCDGREIPINFEWDHNTSEGSWNSVKIFVRIGSSNYDYDTPLIELPQTYDNGQSIPINTTVNFNFPDDQQTTAYFVARAYDSSGNHSEDSNEVSKTVDLLPLESFTFDVNYNASDNTINFSWSITDVKAQRYRIYKSSEENGTYEPVSRIDYVEGQTSYSQSISIDELFPANEKTTVYFKMASWAGEKPEVVQSPYTSAMPITIDRRENVPVDSIINFRLILE